MTLTRRSLALACTALLPLGLAACPGAFLPRGAAASEIADAAMTAAGARNTARAITVRSRPAARS